MTTTSHEFAAKEGEEYKCRQCGRHFMAGSRKLRCCVVHVEGSCCHYTDREISKTERAEGA